MLLKATHIPKTHISAGETGISNPYASKRTKLAMALKRNTPAKPPHDLKETRLG